MVIDAGNSPAHAREIQQAIADQDLPEPRWLVYTHHHWDHTWGASEWAHVEVVAHTSAAELLDIEAARPWSHQYLRDQVAENPLLGPSFRARALAMPAWDGFEVRLPDRTFEDTLSLPTGVELRFVGGNHAPDSVIAMIPDSGVMVLGDCFYPPPYHLRAETDTTDFGMVRRLLAERHAWYVDAHSAPRRLAAATAEATGESPTTET